MELILQAWTKTDGLKFKHYLKSLGQVRPNDREQKIINTQLDYYYISVKDINKIADTIAKGNYLDFIKLWLCDDYQLVLITGILICKLEDFTIFKQYLNDYLNVIDSWSHVDLLKFKINEMNRQQFWQLSLELVKDKRPLSRRTGVIILFYFKSFHTDYTAIFNIIKSLRTETEYYVNMALAWLLAECLIIQRDQTLAFLTQNNLNPFTLRKTISKCCDSFRISSEDKTMLKALKVKLLQAQ